MNKIPAIIIFDVGKTNKKILLFDEQYQLLHEEKIQLLETTDDDGFPCEDVHALTQWIKNSFNNLLDDIRFDIKAVNFSAYGASFVNIDNNGKIVTPLYNYLKPYPAQLQNQFYNNYGDKNIMTKQTASPVLGSLNSGMQLYRLKYENPQLFAQIKYALHLPQYLSYILTNITSSDITSIGCHTNLWNFDENKYHDWVRHEGLENIFAPLISVNKTATIKYKNKKIIAGFGLHDSSAALIPYLNAFHDPFVLLSTGTWNISLNPFNHSSLTDYELEHDCLCYLSYDGKPVKASRLFAGYEHEQQVKILPAHFNKPVDYFTTVSFDPKIIKKIQGETDSALQKNLNAFADYEEAYHQLIADIIVLQLKSTNLVLNSTVVKKIFVDGGFGKNEVYMQLLANAFSNIEVYAASVSQATALGTALAIHNKWSNKPVPENIIGLKLYNASR